MYQLEIFWAECHTTAPPPQYHHPFFLPLLSSKFFLTCSTTSFAFVTSLPVPSSSFHPLLQPSSRALWCEQLFCRLNTPQVGRLLYVKMFLLLFFSQREAAPSLFLNAAPLGDQDLRLPLGTHELTQQRQVRGMREGETELQRRLLPPLHHLLLSGDTLYSSWTLIDL